MIDNFTAGVVYGFCISASVGLIGYFVHCVVRLVKGASHD